MKKNLTTKLFVVIVLVCLAMTFACKGIEPVSKMVTITIEYTRFCAPINNSQLETAPYIRTGSAQQNGIFYQQTGDTFLGEIRNVPTEVVLQVQVNDPRMGQGDDMCSSYQVGQYIKVNGTAVHITRQTCGTPWSGEVSVTIHNDSTVEQFN